MKNPSTEPRNTLPADLATLTRQLQETFRRIQRPSVPTKVRRESLEAPAIDYRGK